MDQLAVEEEHVAGIHQYRNGLHLFRQRHRDVRKALRGVRLLRAQLRQHVTAGHHLQAAVRLVTAVQRQPGRHAGARLHLQVELVLMQRLSARPRRLEIDHRLDRDMGPRPTASPDLRESGDPASIAN